MSDDPITWWCNVTISTGNILQVFLNSNQEFQETIFQNLNVNDVLVYILDTCVSLFTVFCLMTMFSEPQYLHVDVIFDA